MQARSGSADSALNTALLTVAMELGETKRDRSVYLVGPKKGQVRPSRLTRRRRRAQAVEAARQRELNAAEFLAEEAEREEIERAKNEYAGHGMPCFLYRLGRGRRAQPGSVTEFSLDSDDDGVEEGKLVALSLEDVESGRRWFCEEYPERWRETYSASALADMGRRSGGDLGKPFVEYHGVWYEATAVGSLAAMPAEE
jgi:hypothetical protein